MLEKLSTRWSSRDKFEQTTWIIFVSIWFTRNHSSFISDSMLFSKLIKIKSFFFWRFFFLNNLRSKQIRTVFLSIHLEPLSLLLWKWSSSSTKILYINGVIIFCTLTSCRKTVKSFALFVTKNQWAVIKQYEWTTQQAKKKAIRWNLDLNSTRPQKISMLFGIVLFF